MEKATLTGLVLGAVILVACLILGQVPLKVLLKPEALLIVFGGTFTAVLVSFSGRTLDEAFQAAIRCFYRVPYTTAQCVDYLTEIAAFARTQGLLPLQSMIQNIEIPFLRKGLGLLVDNRPELFVRESLGAEVEMEYRQAMDYARVFEVAGGYAPTMGIIGAVIGLIHVVETFHDPVALGQGVAGAFSATLYGVAISNLFLLPMAGKLRQRARDDWFQKNLILEGLMSIRVGEHPVLLNEKLSAFMSQGGDSYTGHNPDPRAWALEQTQYPETLDSLTSMEVVP
jgi:chemotaxis protein MotA